MIWFLAYSNLSPALKIRYLTTGVERSLVSRDSSLFFCLPKVWSSIRHKWANYLKVFKINSDNCLEFKNAQNEIEKKLYGRCLPVSRIRDYRASAFLPWKIFFGIGGSFVEPFDPLFFYFRAISLCLVFFRFRLPPFTYYHDPVVERIVWRWRRVYRLLPGTSTQ